MNLKTTFIYNGEVIFELEGKNLNLNTSEKISFDLLSYPLFIFDKEIKISENMIDYTYYLEQR